MSNALQWNDPASASARFGGQVSAALNDQLETAASLYYDDPARAEQLLLDTLAQAPEALAVHFSLYKFYFYKQRVADAETIARLAMKTAAASGGFTEDWSQLHVASAPWGDVNHPAHFYLFSLKALAFMRLRQRDAVEAFRLLEKLRELDAQDQVGWSVIAALADRANH